MSNVSLHFLALAEPKNYVQAVIPLSGLAIIYSQGFCFDETTNKPHKIMNSNSNGPFPFIMPLLTIKTIIDTYFSLPALRGYKLEMLSIWGLACLLSVFLSEAREEHAPATGFCYLELREVKL